MKRILLLLSLLVLLASAASAQVSSSVARRVRAGASLPATCRASNPVDIFIKTGASAGLYYCSATNTWTAAGGSGISGSTGATDNRVLRADGVGGATLQNSPVGIDDSGNVTGVESITSAATTSPGPFLTVKPVDDAFAGTDELFRVAGAADGTVPKFAAHFDHVLVGTGVELWVGNNATFNGRAIYNTGGNTTFTLENTYANPAATIKLKLNGVDRLTIDGNGLADFNNSVRSPLYSTATNCADSAGAAACGSAAAGSVVIDAAATSVVVSTTAVTANSQIFVQEDSSLGTRLGVTCNTAISRSYQVTARTAGTSFTITASAAPVTNPACLSYTVMN